MQGWGAKDDSAIVRQYFAHPIASVTTAFSSPADETAAETLVLDLLRGVNLVAAAEAVSFARFLNVDLQMFHQLVSDAAGASRTFITQGLEMIEGKIGAAAPAGAPSVEDAIGKLSAAVQKGRDLHCPLHLGNAALSALSMARRAGLGAEGQTSVIKVFGV